MRKTLNIGLFGFGCVGQGLYDVLQHTKGLQANISRICVKNRDKQRSLSANYFTFDKYEILDDPSINVIVELIDDADAAFDIVSYALRKGKAVVSANKKMIAEHFEELLALQKEAGVPFLYEAAACASIPVIRNLEEYYDNDLLNSVEGVVNGSTNYILSRMSELGLPYEQVLQEAQRLGFAESDPALDVEGYDARYKLSLLAAHAFGQFVEPERIFVRGIRQAGEEDIAYAREKGYRLKLVAHARKAGDKLQLWVIPRLLTEEHKLYGIKDEYNGVVIEGIFSDKQFYYGKGAGSHPTASAVLSDISAVSYGYCYEYKKSHQPGLLGYDDELLLRLYCRHPSAIRKEELPFVQVEQEFHSREVNYLVGVASLTALRDSGLLERNDIFIAQVREAVERQESVYEKEDSLAAVV